MSEPRPADEQVPSQVLDELRLAFGDDAPVEARVESAPPVDVTPVDVTPVAAHELGADVSAGQVADVVAAPPTVAAPTCRSAVTSATGATPAAASRATIVIGAGDDDVPDVRYLDEVIDRAERRDADPAERTIVIGDDLDVSGAFDAVPVPDRKIDPRLRERRAQVKRERGRKRLIVVGAVAAVVVLVVAGLAVLSSSLFAVDQVDVQGATYTSARYPEQLQAVVDDMMGQPVLLIDTVAAEEQLERSPWVDRAFVTTDLPNRVFIDVRERQPLAAFVGSDGRYRVIDRTGRVLDVLDGRPRDYLLITGPAPDTEPGDDAGTPFALAAQLVNALPAEIRALTESVSVDATTGDFGLALTGGVDVRLGSFDRIDSKLARLLQRVREGIDGLVGIDVSTDEISDITG